MFSTCKAVLQQILAISKRGLFNIEICSGSVGNWLLMGYLFTLPTYPAAPSWYSWKQKKVQRVVRNRTTRARWRKTCVLNKPMGAWNPWMSPVCHERKSGHITITYVLNLTAVQRDARHQSPTAATPTELKTDKEKRGTLPSYTRLFPLSKPTLGERHASVENVLAWRK